MTSILLVIDRVQGEWIAQNALAVLAVALIIAVVLCLALVWLMVETRPEKVGLWVVKMLQVLKLSKTRDDPLHASKIYLQHQGRINLRL
jgi:hypothetical protein